VYKNIGHTVGKGIKAFGCHYSVGIFIAPIVWSTRKEGRRRKQTR